MIPNLPRENLLDLCRRMFVIRHFEENLVPLHDKGVFGGHYHLYVGQEGYRRAGALLSATPTTISSPRTETTAICSPAAPNRKNYSPKSSAAPTA